MLVPLIERAQVVSIAFIVRPHNLPTHGGQIAFPGGHREPDDGDAATTALRESHGGLGIAAETVEVLGELDDVATPSGFVITSVVGWLADPGPFRPAALEVQEVFEIPLDRLAHPGVYRLTGERVVAGRVFPLPEFLIEGRRIWGATARMVAILLEHMGTLPA